MSHDRKLVPFDRGRRRPDPSRVHEFAATARRLQREREEATGVVERVLRNTPRASWPALAEREELRTMGVLEQFSQEVSRRLESDPLEALAIANVATAVSETLPQDLYPQVVVAQARAHAWKDRAQALCYLARYAEALDALDRAEEQLEPFGTVAHDKAVVRFVRATTLRELGRLDECRRLLAECRNVFADHGDLRLDLYCGIVDGTVLFSLHLLREAAATFTSLLDVARSLNDSLSEARLHNNIAHCLVLLGSYASAEEHLVRALAQFRANGAHTEAARAELARGRMLVSKGDIDNGMSQLYQARRTFLTHGLIEEAGICGLDVVEALIARENFDHAVHLAREIIDDYTAAKLNARAVIALGYLSEAMAAREASAATVEHVRGYIQQLLKEPHREFARMKM